MKRPCLCLAIGVLAAIPSIAAAQIHPVWHRLLDSPQTFRNEDIFFPTPMDGWTVNGSGAIHHTSDGGANWEFQFGIHGTMRCVGFANTQRGWAARLAGPDTLIYFTTNGGKNWEGIPNDLEPHPYGLCGMSVVDESVVFACGAFYGLPHVVRTTDGGSTWKSFDLAGSARNLVDCLFWDRDHGIMVGGVGTNDHDSRSLVLETTDAGETWAPRHIGSRQGEYCWKISFPSRQVGYVSVQNLFSGSPVVLKTTDGGASWVEKPLNSYNGLPQGIGFANETTGWVGGYGGDNRIMETTNGGDSWHASYFMANANRFRFFGNTLGYAAGEAVFKYERIPPGMSREDGALAFTPTGVDGGSGVEPAVVLGPSAPNPMRYATRIPYRLTSPGRVRLTIYDAGGRLVSTLLDADAAGGEHEAVWDGRDHAGRSLPPGTYLYELVSGETRRSRKLLLAR